MKEYRAVVSYGEEVTKNALTGAFPWTEIRGSYQQPHDSSSKEALQQQMEIGD